MSKYRIPKSRLNEIAKRKLDSLGVPTRLTPAQDLVGFLECPAGRLTDPLSGVPIPRVDFVVVGHDRLKLLAPPVVAGFEPLPFYDFDRVHLLSQRISELLARRLVAARHFEARMRTLGIECAIDPSRLVVVGRLHLVGTGIALLEGTERGLHATELLPEIGSSGRRSLGDVAVDLDEFPSRIDLELMLEGWASQALEVPAPAPRPAAPKAPAVREGPVPDGAVTLAMLADRFGGQTRIAPGTTFAQTLLVGDRRLRLDLRYEDGRTFTARVSSEHRALWKGRFELDRFPGLEAFVSAVVSGAEDAPAAERTNGAGSARQGDPDAAARTVALHLLPVVGERWVMDVGVVGEVRGEVRYELLDTGGHAVDGPWALARPDFERNFPPTSAGGRRLVVRVIEAEPTHVVYEALDVEGQAFSGAMQLEAGAFLDRFLAEDAAY